MLSLIRSAAVLLLWTLSATAGETAPLALEEVLVAATRAFPSLLAAEQRKDVAAGEKLAAEGGFDTLLKSQNRWSIAGLYENRNYDVSIEQPTGLWGATFFGGWRRGLGEYPVYEGKSLTATDGEARVGVNVPLWRNGPIDRRRAGLKQAELGELIAGHEYDQALIELRRVAAHRYWDWVLAGRRLRVAEAMLDIAEKRDAGIRRRVAAGDIAEFEAADNQRAILERRERQVASRRLLEQTAIQLSLYWRDEQGQPQLPDPERLPPAFPKETPGHGAAQDFAEALATAQARRPELQRLDLQQRQTETELELQRNQQAPGVDFSVMGARDIGPGKDKLNREELYLGLNIDIPLQRRVAGGRAQAAAANLQRLKLEQQMAGDRIAAEVRDALSALEAARQRLDLAGKQRQAAQRLEQGERTRFELGDSTLLFVNLREIASGDAALMEADAATALFKAQADYQAALGEQGSVSAKAPLPP
jgi:outer membrane protein TolC